MYFVSFCKAATATRVRRALLAMTFAPLLWVVDASLRPDMPPVASATVVRNALMQGASAAPATSASEPVVWQVQAQGPIPSLGQDKAAHASSLLPSSAGLLVFWFSGDRESGPLVQIAATQWDAGQQQWLPARAVVNRHTLGRDLGLGVRRLGNPVAWRDGQGRIHLFVVGTGWGGWAASRVVHLRQCDNPAASDALSQLCFEPVGVLPLAWGWNTSYLVRNAPLPLADGGMVLPVHFELGSKVPALLRFDAQGGYLGMVRISQRDYALQPALLPLGEHHWLALMRDERHDGRILAAQSQDGGKRWQDLPDLDLLNPDSAVSGLTLPSGELLLAHNNSPSGRERLDLSASRDGAHWGLLRTLESGKPEDEFSYPAMAWVDGQLWVTYTVDRARLAWQRLAPVPASVERKTP
ncbi:exo-alpha-sialidase [Curvibacter sp. CHRR-16]|uniref:exo-alpha-sialidase n=1 Tax=Curvibacter sp. CHRR-16 TaxID=2835872 RepID=UPI001BDAFF79|nr:sialidase family protein [Curvibacter sp. CHRR-16]MBT0569476.1 exo-alpha-sialidase [Curvibacter sp. CHRR-16]